MFVLQNGHTNQDLSPWLTRYEMLQCLIMLCNVAREELAGPLENFIYNRDIEKLYQEQEYERTLWEERSSYWLSMLYVSQEN